MLTTFLTRAEVSRRMQALHLLDEVKQAFAVRGVQQTVGFEVPGHEIGRASCRERVCPYV